MLLKLVSAPWLEMPAALTSDSTGRGGVCAEGLGGLGRWVEGEESYVSNCVCACVFSTVIEALHVGQHTRHLAARGRVRVQHRLA